MTSRDSLAELEMRMPPLNIKVAIVLSSVGGLLATASVVLYARSGWRGVPVTGAEKAFHLVILCLWIVVPPLWFAVEPELLNPTQDRDALTKKQELYARIWVGVSAMLGVLATAMAKI